MPIYTCYCDNENCGSQKIVKEVLCKISQRNDQPCKDCGKSMNRLVDLPAKTPGLWEAGWTEGLGSAGKYDAGLGAIVYNEKQRDKLLASKGLIRESDLGTDFVEKKISKEKEEHAETVKFSKAYKENITKFGGDKERALVETLPAKEILNNSKQD